MKPSVSCIIPFRNEGERIGEVLKQIVRIKLISQIICVDGCSTDDGYKVVEQFFPRVGLIRMPKNLGKTEAVEQGVKKATGDYILLLDADLEGIKEEEINRAIAYLLANQQVDMLILRRLKASTPFESRLARSDLIFSGERILKKKDLEAILKQKPTKFQLEIATNQYMIKHKKLVYWCQCSTRSVPKTEKMGYLEGLISNIKMKINVMSYDFIGYFWQTLFFCHKKAPFWDGS